MRATTDVRTRGGRVAVFLDLENLLFAQDRESTEGLLQGLIDRLRRLVGEDTVVVAVGCCDRRLAARTAFLLRQIGVRVFPHRGGPEAADLDLIARIVNDRPSSCQRVILGSGDGRFAGPAKTLRMLGLRVEVVARAGSLARELGFAADAVHLLGSDAGRGAA